MNLREKLVTLFSARTTTEDDRDPLRSLPRAPLPRISIFTLRVVASLPPSPHRPEHRRLLPMPATRAPSLPISPGLALGTATARQPQPPPLYGCRPIPIDPSTPSSPVPATHAPPPPISPGLGTASVDSSPSAANPSRGRGHRRL
jgi:hypothetical protein